MIYLKIRCIRLIAVISDIRELTTVEANLCDKILNKLAVSNEEP